ncbi:hypothetical protein FKP32DRAFT_1615973 [Trametes sanguinea]|nr:hypothetical protein FKP32DRAFT_1615973 [Trametes sanguinea]
MESSFSSTSIAPPSGVAQPLRRPVSVVNNGTIGHPHTFTIGLLSPRTIRVRLEEIQKPDLGRKYARKDKRPLDPPPVVLCRFYNITKGRDGKFIEIEMDPEQPAMGAICHLDLFPVPPQYYEAEEHLQRPTQVTMHDPVQHAMQGMRSPTHIPTPASIAAPQHDTASANTMFQLPSIPSHAVTSSVSPTLLGSALSTYPGRPSNSISSAGEPEKRDIVAWYGDVPIHESSKCSAMLSGGTSMQAEVIDYKGKKSAVFVFPDVAVKAEGLFFLRYRAFNVLSKCAAPTPMPVLAECYGGPFKIYSSKEFPGLQASTELTKGSGFVDVTDVVCEPFPVGFGGGHVLFRGWTA